MNETRTIQLLPDGFTIEASTLDDHSSHEGRATHKLLGHSLTGYFAMSDAPLLFAAKGQRSVVEVVNPQIPAWQPFVGYVAEVKCALEVKVNEFTTTRCRAVIYRPADSSA